MNTGSLADRYWVHDLDPFLVKFTETFGIRYYGLSYMLGFLAGFLLLHLASRRGRSPLGVAQNADFLFALVIGVLAGGRLGYFLLYETGSVARDPLMLLRVWEGGMASHGGFIGVLLAMIWFARSRKVGFWQLADLTCMITPPGLFFGRIANFINGELWGRVTEVRWAVIFPDSDPGAPLERIQPRHPSQLYEAGLEGAVLFAFVALRFWRGRTREVAPGRIAGEFLVVYAALRIFGELFREPDASLILGMSRGIFYSIVMGAAGIAIAVLAQRRAARSGSIKGA